MPSEVWQARESVNEWIAYLDSAPNAEPVASFYASAVSKDKKQRFIEGRPAGTFVVWPKYVCFFTLDQKPYGEASTQQLLGDQIQLAAEIAGHAYDVLKLSPSVFIKGFRALGKMLSDGLFSTERQFRIAVSSPNSFILPLSAIKSVNTRSELQAEKSELSNPLPHLQITTRERSFWIYEEEKPQELGQPPQLRLFKLVVGGLRDMMFGWQPELLKYLKDQIGTSEATPEQVKPIGKAARQSSGPRKVRKRRSRSKAS